MTESKFNIDDYLNNPETKRLLQGKRNKLMGLPAPPPMAPRSEAPQANGPEDEGAVPPAECAPMPAKPSLRLVEGGGVPEPQDLPASLLPVPAFDPDLLPENLRG